VAMQQLDHLCQAILQAFLRLFGFYFSHSALHPQLAGTPEGINQVLHDCAFGVLSNYWVSPWWYSTSPGGADAADDNTATGLCTRQKSGKNNCLRCKLRCFVKTRC